MLTSIITTQAQVEVVYDSNYEDKISVNDDRLKVFEIYSNKGDYSKGMEIVLSVASQQFVDFVDFYRLNADDNEADEILGLRQDSTYSYLVFIKNDIILKSFFGDGSMSLPELRKIIIKHY